VIEIRLQKYRLFLILFYFGSIGVYIQGLALARKALHHLNPSSSFRPSFF
jgi:hypothetical protein